MQVVTNITDLTPFQAGHLVPTMGALHAGHAALIHAAREHAGDEGHVIVSIFVNPAQFNEHSDFEDYPRTLDSDAHICARLNVDCVFAPSVDEIYPPGELDRSAQLPPVATEPNLEDHFRPGHFDGVYRVCRRLMEIAKPRRAYFGEKDWQQLQLMRALVAHESLSVDIVGVPTVRERDGIALSSRNVHLTTADRARALAISRAFVEAGHHLDPIEAQAAGLKILHDSDIRAEYFAIRDAQTLLEPRPGHPGRVLGAGVGRTRLIDNATWPGFTLD